MRSAAPVHGGASARSPAWLTSLPQILDMDRVKEAESIIKAGLVMFPTRAFMIMLYSNFLWDVLDNPQAGYSQLQAAKKANPNYMERFAIYRREQARAVTQPAATEPQACGDSAAARQGHSQPARLRMPHRAWPQRHVQLTMGCVPCHALCVLCTGAPGPHGADQGQRRVHAGPGVVCGVPGEHIVKR
jgi:hypothetical protein